MYRIDAGGPQESDAPVWAVDTQGSPSSFSNFAATQNNVFSDSTPIDMSDPSIPPGTPMSVFQTERWAPPGSELHWAFPVTPGSYTVQLYFAEIYSGAAVPGARVFNVLVNNSTVLSNYDVTADVGAFKGVVKTFSTNVTGSELDIDLTHVTENPAIKAIQILKNSGSTGTLGVNAPDLPFGSGSAPYFTFGAVQQGASQTRNLIVTNLGKAGDPSINLTAASIIGDGAAAFSTDFSGNTSLAPGQSKTIKVTFAPSTSGGFDATLSLTNSSSNSPLQIALRGWEVTSGSSGVSFGKGTLGNTPNLHNPTSLQFGPDGKLYVVQQDGTIRVYAVTKNSPSNYSVSAEQDITSIFNIPNHNDDGSLAPSVSGRTVTGLLVVGTATNPVIYVSSSDPRVSDPNSSFLNGDTNSGIISRLTWNGSSWVKLDLVRGLPRSSNDHVPNGLQLNAATNTLYLAVAGNTNMGAPSHNFHFLPEYALSGAILSINLTQIGNTTYDLPTLIDDNAAINANSPFGGDFGKHQAKIVTGGPVQVYAAGFRNPYDLVIAQNGFLYTIDNGPNAGWGDVPIFVNGLPTNQPNDPGQTYQDNLHVITGAGGYFGHPDPTRATTTVTFNTNNPQSPVPSGDSRQGNFQIPGPANNALALFPFSTNGITQYNASNFNNALNGDLIAASFGNLITDIKLSADGLTATSVTTLFSNVGSTPLDVTTQGDSGAFPGTIWVADIGTSAIYVFEPGGGVVVGGTDDPTIDDDGDGFSNHDEILNLTSPASNADVPEAFGQNKISNLLNPDDDGDGILDAQDAFAVDPANGKTTNLPVVHSFSNSLGGLLDLGFTGLMTNGSTNYLSQFDPTALTAGGAAGVLTVDQVSSGDALGALNTQQNAFQFGINVNGSSAAFTLHTQIPNPFGGIIAQTGRSMGLYFGAGDQDNYAKIVVTGNGGGGIQFVKEVGGVATTGQTDGVALPGPSAIDLYILVDPATNTIQAKYSLTNGSTTGPIINLGTPQSIPSGWLSNATKGPAVGFISTNGGTAPFAATWASVDVQSTPIATMPTVTVAATTATANETTGANGVFTFTRTGSTTNALTINFTVGGTATSGTDYTALGTSVTIPAGSASVTKNVVPVNDGIAESTETVILTLASNAAYTVGSPSAATVNIVDGTTLPSVSVSATTTTANESTGANGVFTFTRTGATTNPLTINFTVAGTATSVTDYTALGSSVTIPAGAASVTKNVVPVNDGTAEKTETVVLTLSANAAYALGSPFAAPVNIVDAVSTAQSVTSLTLVNAANGTPIASFNPLVNGATIDISQAALQNISVRANTNPATVGSVLFGLDSNPNFRTETGAPYALTGNNGNVYVKWSPTVGLHTITATPYSGGGLTGTVGTPLSITINVVNGTTLPTVSVSATGGTANETTGANGVFTFTRSGSTTNALTINFTVGGTATSGTDYTALGTSVTIPAGATSVTKNVVPVNDGIAESTETVILTLSANAAYTVGSPSSATVNIVDGTTLPGVTVSATTATANETTAANGVFTFTRTGATTNPLTINFTVGGTATSGTDYTALGTSVTIPAGSASVTKNVVPVNDGVSEGTETVVLTLSSNAAYTVGSPSAATVNIVDGTTSTQAVTTFTLVNASNGTPITGFDPLLDGATIDISQAALQNISVRANTNPATVGSVLFGLDSNPNYHTESGAPYALNGNTGNVYVKWSPAVGQHTITATPYTGSGLTGTVGTPLTITVNVVNGTALPSVSVAATTPTANETNGTAGVFTIARAGSQTNPLTVNFSIGGTATNGTDYTTLANSVTIPANGASATVTVSPISDDLVEGSETVVLTISSNAAYSIGSPANSTVTINEASGLATFSGTALAVPGFIEAENFDHGGEGVAYHDNTAANEGGAYRSTGVDLQVVADAGGGFGIGHIQAGEWVKYTVDVQTAGNYTITTRIAAGGGGGTYHYEIDGADVTGTQLIGNTGDWTTFVNQATASFALTAGQHVLRLVWDATNGGDIADVNWIQFDAGTNIPTPVTFSALLAVPSARIEAMAASVGGKFYVFGGFINSMLTATANLDIYDPGTNSWSSGAALPQALTHSAIATTGQFVYILGGEVGSDGGTVTNAVYKYDTVANTYTTLPTLPLARGGGGAAIVNNILYFFGGLKEGFQLDGNGEAFKLDLNDLGAGWSPIASMPNPRNHMGGAALNGKVYAIGGQHNRDESGQPQSEVDMYDPASNTWTTVASLPIAMNHNAGGTFVFQSRIVVMGGETFGGIPVATIFEYNPATNRWSQAGIAPAPRKSPTAGFIGNQLIYATGAASGGVDATNTAWLSSTITLL